MNYNPEIFWMTLEEWEGLKSLQNETGRYVWKDPIKAKLPRLPKGIKMKKIFNKEEDND